MSVTATLVRRALSEDRFRAFRDAFERAGVQSWLTPGEMALHFGVGAFSEGSRHLVEIGAFEGASAAFAAAGLKHGGRGLLYSVDPHLGGPPALGTAPWQFTLGKFETNMRKLAVSEFVKSLVCDSLSAAAVWPALPIDSLLIDGDHSFLGAMRDFESWAPKLRPGGLIMVDDADDAALPEVLEFVSFLRCLRCIVFDDMVDGVAVFRRGGDDNWALMRDIAETLDPLKMRRPWDIAYIQDMGPATSFRIDTVGGSHGLQTAYQLGFLARCGPGMYGITRDTTAIDRALLRRIAGDRRDGDVCKLNRRTPPQSCRAVFTSVDQVGATAKYLMLGGMMFARSARPATHENAIEEKKKLLAAGLDACGWHEDIHWGIREPHHLSMDGILAGVDRCMVGETSGPLEARQPAVKRPGLLRAVADYLSKSTR
jgi:predicted O-methyltransferase YrrM